MMATGLEVKKPYYVKYASRQDSFLSENLISFHVYSNTYTNIKFAVKKVIISYLRNPIIA